MKKNFKFVLLAAAALAFAACGQENTEPDTPNEEPEEEVLNQSLAFTLEVTEVSHDQAKVKVSHNGETKDTWYGFVTDNVKGNIATLVEAEVASLIKDGKVSGLKKQRSTTVTLRGLEPETDYIYIVFGLSEKGEVYGTPLSTEFKTARDADEMEETDDWKISYQRGENQGQTAEIFTIKCEAGKGYYFTTVDTYSLEAEGMTVKDYVLYVVNEEIPMYLSYGYSWEDLYIPESYTLAAERMISGDYVAIAVGFDAKGNATGAYSAQEFTVVEEAADAQYSQWLGNWNVTSSYQYEDEETGEILTAEVTYPVTLHHYDNNYMYVMTGWEEVNDVANGLLDIREYVGEYVVPVYYNNGKLEFQETTLDYFELGEYGYYYFGFYGIGNLSGGGQSVEGTLLAIDGMPIAQASTEDGQAATINGMKVKYGSYDIEYTGMFYCAYPDAESGSLAYWNNPMFFPISMVKTAEGKAQQNIALPVSLKAKTAKKIQNKTITPRFL